MGEVFSFLSVNKVEIMAALGSLFVVARLVVMATPTPKDDELLAKVLKIAKILGLVVGEKK